MGLHIGPKMGGGGVGNTYTPIATLVGNLTSVTPLVARFQRTGRIVSVDGIANFQAIGAGVSTFELTLPFTSSLLTSNDLSGIFQVTDRSAAAADGSISGFTANRARFSVSSLSAAALSMRYHYSYTILN